VCPPHDHFGRGANDAMKSLKAIRGHALAQRTAGAVGSAR
jgi:hypothetical protein